MFIIIDSSNRSIYRDLLEDLYRARYDSFVLGRGWSDLERPDGRDIDQFDDEDTVYVVGLEQGEVIAGCRIRPSRKPHLLKDAFPHLADGDVPVGDEIFECSRLFVKRRHPDRAKVFNELLLKTIDWYRENNGSLLTGVIENWWLTSFLSLGFNIAPLGRPEKSGRSAIIAVRVVIDDALQAGMQMRVASDAESKSVLRSVQSGFAKELPVGTSEAA